MSKRYTTNTWKQPNWNYPTYKWETIIRTVTEKKKKTQTPKIHQTKRQTKSKRTQIPSLLKWPLLLDHHRPPPMGKL